MMLTITLVISVFSHQDTDALWVRLRLCTIPQYDTRHNNFAPWNCWINTLSVKSGVTKNDHFTKNKDLFFLQRIL